MRNMGKVIWRLHMQQQGSDFFCYRSGFHRVHGSVLLASNSVQFPQRELRRAVLRLGFDLGFGRCLQSGWSIPVESGMREDIYVTSVCGNLT